MDDKRQTLEDQKNIILEQANDRFGREYFEKLEQLSKDFLIEEEPKEPKYILTVNHKGAFYAS